MKAAHSSPPDYNIKIPRTRYPAQKIMNLDDYRRAYMRAEGFGNTPKRLLDRLMTLGKSIIALPGAVNKDRYEKRKRKENFKEAWNDIKQHGIDAQNISSLMNNGPRVSTNTSRAIGRVADSSLGTAKSLNELGQTASSIIGTTRQNAYEGQDLEKGISFALSVKSYINKAARIPPAMMKGVQFGIVGGTILVNSINLRKPTHKTGKSEKERKILHEHEEER